VYETEVAKMVTAKNKSVGLFSILMSVTEGAL